MTRSHTVLFLALLFTDSRCLNSTQPTTAPAARLATSGALTDAPIACPYPSRRLQAVGEPSLRPAADASEDESLRVACEGPTSTHNGTEGEDE